MTQDAGCRYKRAVAFKYTGHASKCVEPVYVLGIILGDERSERGIIRATGSIYT
jgi:hypothetical protein